MKIDANDPRWTAYVLGEMSDATERAEFDKAVEESEEMRKLVDDIQATAGLLTKELRSEPSATLTADQRRKIEAQATGSRFIFKPVWMMAAAAAVLVLVSFVALRYFRQNNPVAQPTQVASVKPPKSVLKEPVLPLQIPEPKPEKKNLSNKPTVKTTPVEKTHKPSALQQTQLASATPQNPVTTPEPNKPSTNETPTTTLAQTPLPTVPSSTLIGKVQNPIRAALPVATADTKVEVVTSAQNILIESSSSTGTTSKPQAVTQLPLVSNDMMDLINIMGGVVKADDPIFANNEQSYAGVDSSNIILTRDGITISEVRNRPANEKPSRMNREFVGEYKMILSPIDAEVGRGFGQMKELTPPLQRQGGPFNTEGYQAITDNPFMDVVQNPLSTFSIDVDTASYSNVRRFLDGGSLPPKDAVRIEELVNYFDYDYKGPKDGKPFAVNFEITEAPWNPAHRLLRIGLKGREIEEGKRPSINLVFLLDVSGSMADENKLPLVKQAMRLLVDKLTESDRVAIVVYAGTTDTALPSTSGDQKEKILHAIECLQAGGSTNGASGIQLAYKTALENFIKGGVNRVILATDGDFNVGVTNQGDLTRLIEANAKTGIYLSALGFGMGNLKDGTLELLADKGHGNYAYIDTINEAKKVLVQQINSTLISIAKDVKIQVEFNPQHVGSYRLIGYENRVMPKEDFNDDKKQAGVIGAGHAVTALYELVPAGSSESKPGVDPLKYQKPVQPSSSANSNELVTVKIRSKKPDEDRSELSEFAVKDSEAKFDKASQDFKFAASVASFGMVLRDSPYKGTANLDNALEWAKEGKGIDRYGYRDEFIRLIYRAMSLKH
jgi:Ca-activated chloride channel homolog